MTLSKDSKIYVAGHRGLVGSAIWKNLQSRGYGNLVGRTHDELDLTNQAAVKAFFDEERPDAVVLAAAFVGGIMANSLYRADFIMQNMMIQCNVIGEAYRHGVKKLLFLGSTCIYPKNAPQPMKEDALLTSPLEYTNEEYAIAKIAGLKMCESYNLQYGTNYIAVMPTNLYGPNDNFHLENSHVMPAMIRKIWLAKLLHGQAWEAIRHDLSKRPVEAVDGKASEEDIVGILSKYGIRDNRVKEQVLGVSAEDLKTHGAVSEEVVKQMVNGVRNLLHTDFAIATSGIAGPDGGTPEKPVGTVWIGWATPEGTFAECFHLGKLREQITDRACQKALIGLYQRMTRNGNDKS